EVKLFSADGSWGIPPVRVGRRQAHDRKRISLSKLVFFCFRKLFLAKDGYIPTMVGYILTLQEI
ncbi:hypothetical protein, partial [Bacillus capparidis]|uniref:hypothetical protein n=1 Tax=Bacillus capparidis TaxID=1840411 RepID=UPI002E23E9EF|nr:hypothetical protein [Bacillus capparidis]